MIYVEIHLQKSTSNISTSEFLRSGIYLLVTVKLLK